MIIDLYQVNNIEMALWNCEMALFFAQLHYPLVG